jgi:hypothetical protein
VNQSNSDAVLLPPLSASAIPAGRLNESFSSHILVVNRGTKGITGTSNSPMSIDFQQQHNTMAAVYQCQSPSQDHPHEENHSGGTTTSLTNLTRSTLHCFSSPFHCITPIILPCVFSICSELTSTSATKQSV